MLSLRQDSPKVDQTENEPRDDGKIGEIEAHGGSRRDREGNVMTRTNRPVESDSGGDDDIANGACRGSAISNDRFAVSHGGGSLPPAESERDDRSSLLHRADVCSIRQPQKEIVDPVRDQHTVTPGTLPPNSRFPIALHHRDNIDIGVTPSIVGRIRGRWGFEIPVRLGEPPRWLGSSK